MISTAKHCFAVIIIQFGNPCVFKVNYYRRLKLWHIVLRVADANNRRNQWLVFEGVPGKVS